MKLREYRNKLREMLASISPEEGDIIADMLLCEALETERGYLLAHLDDDVPRSIDPFISGAVFELSMGKPLQYVLGKCNFYSYEIHVGDGVFIPRSDTEIGVKAALGLLKDGDLFADEAVFKAVDEASGTDGEIISLGRSAVERHAVLFADIVDIGNIAALDRIPSFDLLCGGIHGKHVLNILVKIRIVDLGH